MKLPFLIWLLLLTILHQDFWLWNESRLVFGFLPAGMAYHVLYSFVTAATWWAATRWAWPEEWEAWADEKSPEADEQGGA